MKVKEPRRATKPLSVRVSIAVRQRIDDEARRLDRSVGYIVRQLLDKGLEKTK